MTLDFARRLEILGVPATVAKPAIELQNTNTNMKEARPPIYLIHPCQYIINAVP